MRFLLAFVSLVLLFAACDGRSRRTRYPHDTMQPNDADAGTTEDAAAPAPSITAAPGDVHL